MKKERNNSTVKANHITQFLATLLVVLLVLSVNTLVLGAQSDNNEKIVKQISFSTPKIIQSEDNSNFVKLEMEGASLSLYEKGAPIVPRQTLEIDLPLGVTRVKVQFEYFSPEQTLTLDNDKIITPAPAPVPLTNEKEYPFVNMIKNILSLLKPTLDQKDTESKDYFSMDESIYSENRFYPYERFTYDVRVGRNSEGVMGTYIVANIFPCQVNSVTNEIHYITDGTISVSYEENTLNDQREVTYYDLLVISANSYIKDLQPLVEHKEKMGLLTKLVSLDDIYNNVYEFDVLENPVDNQEIIKYFIYQAWKNWDIKYTLTVGGFRSFFGLNRPSLQFPIRWLPEGSDEPGYVTEQYYSCFLKYHHQSGYTFDDSLYNFQPSPDVFYGRLACRNKKEVKTMVDKIIHYETETYGSDWFNQMVTITGDGFQDLAQHTPNTITWNTDNVPDGEYIVFAQSYLEDNSSVKGPIDTVTVTVDKTAESDVNFHESDHLIVEKLEEDQPRTYPGKPVAHIVVPSEHDILGNTKVDYAPPEAYGNDHTGWASVDYSNGKINIMVKSYDPSPKESISENHGGGVEMDFASRTYFDVWVNDSQGNTVFGPITKYSKLWYEGEMECQKAIEYMPDEFEKIKLWTSNGNWTGMWDVINTMSEGQGFVYFAGHGNPMSWGDHLPGIPGGRGNGMINGLKCFSLDFGLARYESEQGDPFLPMNQITNGYKLPVVLIGGCHNSAIDSSFTRLFTDPEEVLFTILHGLWVPECYAWWLARVPQGGAIATIGCAGLGYGSLGDDCIDGLGGWINPEFFRIYGQECRDFLGEVFTCTLTNFANGQAPNGYHAKTFKEWVLLGDPSLKIGGYSSTTESGGKERYVQVEIGEIAAEGPIIKTNISNTGSENIPVLEWDINVESDSPLGYYFGGSPLLVWLFKGRILRGTHTTDAVAGFDIDEILDIQSVPVFGLGHCLVNVTVTIGGDIVTSATEDGFLLFNKLALHHPEE